MSALHPLSTRGQLAVAALLLLSAVIITLLILAPTAAAILVGSLALLGLVMLALRASASARMVPRAARTARPAAGTEQAEALPTLQLTLRDGEVLAARQVPLHQPSEHQLLLTRKGYMVVNARGRVIHHL